MESKKRLLIVDDEQIVCVMAKRSFEHDGYEVTTFTDSVRALAAIKVERFDLIITDLKMKEVDGMQLLEAAKEQWPDIPVILLTAFASMGSAVESLRKRAFDYFPKPVKIDDLKASVRRALTTPSPSRV
jgi:DNA-binding NtrC family response regulator